MSKHHCVLLLSLFLSTYTYAQKANFFDSIIPRSRVIIDNDFGGDPDGLFQLAHQVLSPSTKIAGIIGSHLRKGDGFDPSDKTATHAAEKAREVIHLLQADSLTVTEGTNEALATPHTPIASAGAKLIVKEAMRTDVKTPLYIVCGAGLTEIASAYLLEPAIVKHIILVWIGGPEYEGTAPAPPNSKGMEYNLAIDPIAARVIFNQSQIPIWQVPRNAYRQCLYSYAELEEHIDAVPGIGTHLMDQLRRVTTWLNKVNFFIGETYVLGDSPLVLLTALQSSFEPDPSSSSYMTRQAPVINDQGGYVDNPNGRPIRVYTHLDTRLMISDFYSKLKRINK